MVSIGTLLVLVFLVGMWIALLAGPVIQRNSAGRGGDPIGALVRKLASRDRSAAARPGSLPLQDRTRFAMAIEPGSVPVAAAGRPALRRPTNRSRAAARRRRQVLTGLGGVSTLSLLLWIAGVGFFGLLFALSLLLLVGYVGAMLYLFQVHAEREMKVAFLPHQGAVRSPTSLDDYRRTAQGRR